MGNKRAARVGLANRRIEVLDAEQQVVELDLLTDVVRRFIEVASAQDLVALQARATAIAEQTVSLLEPLVRAGQTPQLELDRANSALIRAQVAGQSAAAMLASARIRLANMWASTSPQFVAVESNLLTVGQAEPIESILAGLELNPDIEIYASEFLLLEA